MSRELLSGILRSEGCRALTAPDGPSAVAECAREEVDLILLDLGLPGNDGFNLCVDLKRNPTTTTSL